MTAPAPLDCARELLRKPPTRFVREFDMHAPIAALAADLAAGLPGHRSQNAHVLFEVPAVAGVPDVLRVAFHAARLRNRARLGLGPVIDITALRVLLATGDGPRPLAGVAQAARVTSAHLRRAVVPALAEAGWLTPLEGRGDQTPVVPAVCYRSLVRSLVTVEAKRRDWRGAIVQARRHQSCADRAYIAIDVASSARLTELAGALSEAGIGVLTVSADTDSARLVTRPVAGFPHVDEHSLMGERAWSLVLAGRNTWDTFTVFGRDLALGG